MDKLTITQEMIEAGMSRNGGLSNKQITLLGFGRYSGWRKRAVGKEILTEKYKEFLSLKDVHLKNRKPGRRGTLLDKALTFIIDNFTDDGKFHCLYALNCDYAGYKCDRCKTKTDVCDILGIE